MTEGPNHSALEASLSPAEKAADAKLELLLDEALASRTTDPLPLEFTGRVLAGRPFAPWEVRRASVWKVPVLAFFALLGASAAVFALPLFRLGPGTAFALWGWATLAALTRPVVALVSSMRLLPQAGEAVGQALGGGTALFAGASALVSLALTALLARRRGSRAAGAYQA